MVQLQDNDKIISGEIVVKYRNQANYRKLNTVSKQASYPINLRYWQHIRIKTTLKVITRKGKFGKIHRELAKIHWNRKLHNNLIENNEIKCGAKTLTCAALKRSKCCLPKLKYTLKVKFMWLSTNQNGQ